MSLYSDISFSQRNRVTKYLVFYVAFFFSPLHCLFFYLRLLITIVCLLNAYRW